MRSTGTRFKLIRVTAVALSACAVLCSYLPADAAVQMTITQISPNTSPQAICVGGTATFTAVVTGNATGNYAETQSNPGSSFASLSPNSTQTVVKDQAVTYTLTGVSTTSSTQTVTITATGTGGPLTGTDLFTVSTQGALGTPSKTSLAFDGTIANGSGTNPQAFTIADTSGLNVTATITGSPIAATFNNGLTTQTVSSSGGSATFTVVPTGTSSSTPVTNHISFQDARSCAENNAVTITVTPGVLTVTSPTGATPTLTFAGPSAASQNITVTDFNYIGTLAAALGSCNPTCSSVATVSPASTPGPGAGTQTNFVVKPSGFGNGTVTLTGNGPSKTVTVLVDGASITATGSPVTYNLTGAVLTNQTSSTLSVTGSLETTGTGTGSIALQGPSNDITTGSGTLPISALSYTCTLTGSGTNQGAAPQGTQVIVKGPTNVSSPCLTFPSSQFSNLSFNLNLILQANTANSLPAGTYSVSNGFTIFVSAT